MLNNEMVGVHEWRRDARYIRIRMLKMELPVKRIRGKPKRFMDMADALDIT